jgi:hypothetical protein
MWEATLHLDFGERPFHALDPSTGIGHFKRVLKMLELISLPANTPRQRRKSEKRSDHSSPVE